MPTHIHVSALGGVITALYVIAILGTLNLVAQKYKATSPLAASYARLFGV